ncbi:MAG TPA: DUF2141 domain-containing protein [Elusimicrobiales bacterium]|nr:DUF2141 domain-containing protein [Elusimicrobiales bacterium]
MAIISALAFRFLLGAGTLHAQQPSGDILAEVTGFRSSTGTAGYALFSSEKGFPMKSELAELRGFAEITGSSCSISLSGLAPGRYALSVFHDENGNRRLDLNALGIPREGTGVSNNVKGRFGPPGYKAAAFVLDSTHTRLHINVTYRGR